MNVSNAHAESRILRRVIGYYDDARNLGADELGARTQAVNLYARLARLDSIKAAEYLADALARRASLKQENVK